MISGLDGPERTFLVSRALQLGMPERLVCLVGLAPREVAALMAGAPACVQPSHAEPFGLAVIEAGACGVPVAASAVGGHLELLRHEETGFLFASGDESACAAVLRQIIRNPENAKEVATRFCAEILDRFTWDRCACEYLALNTKGQTSNSTGQRTSHKVH